LPLPIQAEFSCRRQSRVNTLRVCADEPPARRPRWLPCGTSCPPQTGPAGQLGETIAALRKLRPTAISDQRLAACGQHAVCQRTRSPDLASAWADQIPQFPGGLMLPSPAPVLLHTMRQHLLTAEGPQGAWRLDGLTGFEPAVRAGARVRARRRQGCSPPTAIADS